MADDQLFGSWLSATRELQETAFQTDFSRFSTDPADPEALRRLIEYISWNTKAATHELVELDGETSWKPWQHDEPYVRRREVIKEAVDVLHFVANILCGVGCTDEELSGIYAGKMLVNRERQARGYRVTAAGEKCKRCARALDDIGAGTLDPNVCQLCERGMLL